MAKYDVIYKCGHKSAIQIFGPAKNRQRQADYEATKLCSDCWRAEMTQKCEAENAIAITEASNSGLPPLAGSPKQVAWATTLRHNYIKDLTIESKPKTAEVAKAILSLEASAKWWIDHRMAGAYLVVVHLAKKYPDAVKATKEKYEV